MLLVCFFTFSGLQMDLDAIKIIKPSAVFQYIDSLIDTNPFLPILSRHLADHLPQDLRTVLIEGQLLVLRLAIHFKLVLAEEGQIFIIKDIHGEPYPPYVRCLAGVPIATGELMLRPSKTGSPSGEVRDIIVLVIPNRCKVHYLDLISQVVGLPADNVVHLDVPVGNLVVVQVLHPLTDLQEDDAGDVSQVCGTVFAGKVANHLGVSIVAEVKLVPVHYLAQVAQFVHADDAIVSVYDLVTLSNVFVPQPLEDVQLVVEDVQTIGELPISGKETMLFESQDGTQLQGEFSVWRSSHHHCSKGSPSQF